MGELIRFPLERRHSERRHERNAVMPSNGADGAPLSGGQQLEIVCPDPKVNVWITSSSGFGTVPSSTG